jgi:hypothetical protein
MAVEGLHRCLHASRSSNRGQDGSRALFPDTLMLIHHLAFHIADATNEMQAKAAGQVRSPSHKRSRSRATVGMCERAQASQNRRAFFTLIGSPMNVSMPSYLSPCSAPS